VSPEAVDHAVLGALASDVLRPAVVNAVVGGVRSALRPESRAREHEASRKKLAAVEAEISRLTNAICGDRATSIVAQSHSRPTGKA
jgi:hypothetical protein